MDEYQSFNHKAWDCNYHVTFMPKCRCKTIPPKYAASQVAGYLRGKSPIQTARVYGERKRSFVGQHFWAWGYFVSTVGRDEAVIRAHIRGQEIEDERLEQLKLST